MFGKKSAKKEIEDNKYLYENLKTDLIKQRVDNCLKWYIHKAVKNKYYYYILSGFTIVCPIVSEIVLNRFGDMANGRMLSAVFIGVSTASAAFLTLFDVHRKWGAYRDQAEGIKRFLSLHELEKNKEDKEEELLVQIEESMYMTHKKWLEIFDKKR